MRYTASLAVAVFCVAIVGLVALGADEVAAGRSTPQIRLSAERFLTHLSTDKPIYRIGEMVYVRGVLLDAKRRTPAPDELTSQTYANVEIFGPKGDRVSGGYATIQDSVAAFAWSVPDGQAGGPHRIRISYNDSRFAPAERTFDVRAYRAPRIKAQIVFLRDGYGPGDDVVATVHADRAEGGAADGATVTAVARVDGVEVFRGPSRFDDRGNCRVSFKLPVEIKRGEGQLTFVIEDRGIVESAGKSIPILLQTVDLSIYPEGGDLVADLPTRVYLEARTPTDKPADIAGVVVDAMGYTVATFRTQHEGRARFGFTPKKDGEYTIKISEPSGIATTFPLPPVKSDGAIIRADADVIGRNQPVRVSVAATSTSPLTVTLSKGETEVAAATVAPRGNAPVNVELTPPQWAEGVLIATVWDATGQPLAERLIFRKPARQLRIEIDADKTRYTPGGAAELTIRTTDESGDPVGAVVGVTVTDDTVLEMIEKREQAPRLPVMVLLEKDARELADAHVYLDDADPKAPLALDLLLGTQGWRRFAFHQPGEFLAMYRDEARSVLTLGDASIEVQSRSRRAGMAGRPDRGIFVVDAAKPLGELEGMEIKLGVPARNAAPAAPMANEPDNRKFDRNNMAKQVAAEEAIFKDEDFAGGRIVLRRELFAQSKLSQSMIAVRQYAHAVRSNRMPGDRVDFAETLFWTAAVRTDDSTGVAKVMFDLNDSVTSFRAIADAFDRQGRLGVGETLIESVEPFYLEPKWPLEVTAGDQILLPIGLVNQTDDAIDARLTINVGEGLSAGDLDDAPIDAGGHFRLFAPLAVGAANGDVELTIAANAGELADRVTRTIRIQPLGFPTQAAFGGMLESGAPAAHTIVIPDSLVAGSVTTSVAVYPTPLANMTGALERLIREPHGCFEQTSSTNYPLVMAQQYFLSHTGVDPSLIERSRTSLDKGYAKLVGFECQARGYEWFGADPGHEALTAFGLLEFADMADVMTVDGAMIDRTLKWLLDRRDGKGGFTRQRRALHTWIEDRDCSNAYILWALLEAGSPSATAERLSKEIAAVKNAAQDSDNSYVVALAANVMRLAGENEAADAFARQLASKQDADGWVDGATHSIVGSGGEALRIETTALAVLAWLGDDAFASQTERAIQYLASACEGGRYGSTQSTVLALRAIVAYDRARSRPKAPGSVTVLVDGTSIGDAVSFDGATHGAIELPDIASALTPGEHRVELVMSDGAKMPYSVAVDFHSTVPASSPDCKLDLSVELASSTIAEGESTEINVTVANHTDQPIPTPVAIIGLPGGLEPRHDQLKELVKAGRIAAYEVSGREVVLYWRGMDAGQSFQLPIQVIAAVPGEYTGPASRAYLYYTDEDKQWSDPIKVRINSNDGADTRS